MNHTVTHTDTMACSGLVLLDVQRIGMRGEQGGGRGGFVRFQSVVLGFCTEGI